MSSSRLTPEGQLTIPKSVRERLALRPGDEVEFVESADGVRLRKRLEANPFERWRGFLTHLAGRDAVDFVRESRGE